jgi:hypothetical protein
VARLDRPRGEVACESGQFAADAALVRRGHDVLHRREVDVERRLVALEVVARDQFARVCRLGGDLDAERRHGVEHDRGIGALRLQERRALKEPDHRRVEERHPRQVGGRGRTEPASERPKPCVALVPSARFCQP